MIDLQNIISVDENKKNNDENLYVNNIIVKKNINSKTKFLPYIPTQNWLMQLGERLIS